ncbi:MAG: glycosyltransferase [Patescibacteria group bacterium]|nr:glycosyltransferase [Patescibacteria group bacterium]
MIRNNSTRILMIGTYPIINPRHGGQKRVKAIYDLYKRAHIGDVKYASVIVEKYYQIHGRNDIPISESLSNKIDKSPFLTDLLCGKAIYEDKKVREKFIKLIHKFKPTIIEIEQVYGYLGLKRLLDDIGYQGLLINSSQNIETLMKRDIYKLQNLDLRTQSKTLKMIQNAETKLAQASVLNVAVSKSDAIYMKKHYKAKHVIVAQNGMYQLKSKKRYIRKWQKYFANHQVEHIILFVGSGHLPNMTGFFDILGKNVSFIPRNTRLVVVGGVSDLINNNLKQDSAEDICLTLRIELLGQRSEDDLMALINIADTIILPITQGGGSNLKTAEALLSLKPIVATKYAFRGYEEYSNLPGVYITDSSQVFCDKILQAIKSDTPKLYTSRYSAVKAVLWENTLSTLLQEIKKL